MLQLNISPACPDGSPTADLRVSEPEGSVSPISPASLWIHF